MTRGGLLVLFALFAGTLESQRTLGVLTHAGAVSEGYVLLSPTASRTSYLIDHCGREVHRWEADHNPALTAYLLEDGSLLRTARIGSSFPGGGSGGRIEHRSWDNSVLWTYNYSSDSVHQHHDIEPLPNGNILILAWELHDFEACVAAGRDSAQLHPEGLWSERVVEIRPGANGEAEVVWMWRAWDHLIQDFDSTRLHFGDVAAHPRRLDINFGAHAASRDWLHCNSVDYHPELDQILLSSLHFNELWIIDHSTTISESADSTGGIYGHGGDLIYRWGNPEAYRRGSSDDRKFFGQHDAQWIPEDYPGAGQITVYNNNYQIGIQRYSAVHRIDPMDSAGFYRIDPGMPFGPDTYTWTYHGLPDMGFHSPRMSGVERLANGNTLICAGNAGRIFEIDTSMEVVWDYVNPISANGPLTQGDAPVLNDVARASRYAPDHPAFVGRDLTPGAPLEMEPLPLICPDPTSAVREFTIAQNTLWYPNPFSNMLRVDNSEGRIERIDIFAGDMYLGTYENIPAEMIRWDTGHWPRGVILAVCHLRSRTVFVQQLIRL